MSEDPAKARFFVLNGVRVSGVAMVLFGIVVARGTLGLPAAAAYALIGVGLVDVFVIPQLLARRWRTPR
ncbi:MAG: hypothetical protein ACTHK5_02650 [Tsuneonella sp.]